MLERVIPAVRLMIWLVLAGLLATGIIHISPEPKQEMLKIMPLGDSITVGDQFHNSYRRPLWQMLKNDNERVDFIGSKRTNFPDDLAPNPDFDLDHEGYWGWRADEILYSQNYNSNFLQNLIKQNIPHLVLLHVGTNDLLQDQDTVSTIMETGLIIDQIRQVNPSVKILVAQIGPIKLSDSDKMANLAARIVDYNQKLVQLVDRKTNPASPILIVDQYTGYDSDKLSYDGIHPNARGEQMIATKWLVGIKQLLQDNT
jgi:lysophospholipase L1-like esterase